jgi:hypothetical protein
VGLEPRTVQPVAWSVYQLRYSGCDSVVIVYNLFIHLFVILLLFVGINKKW